MTRETTALSQSNQSRILGHTATGGIDWQALTELCHIVSDVAVHQITNVADAWNMIRIATIILTRGIKKMWNSLGEMLQETSLPHRERPFSTTCSDARTIRPLDFCCGSRSTLRFTESHVLRSLGHSLSCAQISPTILEISSEEQRPPHHWDRPVQQSLPGN